MKLKRAFWLSLVCHSLLLLLLLSLIINTKQKPKLAKAKKNIIHTHLVFSQPIIKKNHKKTKKNKKTITHHHQLTKPKILAIKKIPASLAEHIHNKILADLNSSNININKPGKVVVKFLLTNNGVISNVHLIKSSVSAKLNQAAMHAVEAASPISFKTKRYADNWMSIVIEVASNNLNQA